MVTRCCFCGGATKPATVTAENWWGNQLALVEDVPAQVCEDCGEPYFEADTAKELDRLRMAPPVAERVVEVPVYSFGRQT